MCQFKLENHQSMIQILTHYKQPSTKAQYSSYHTTPLPSEMYTPYHFPTVAVAPISSAEKSAGVYNVPQLKLPTKWAIPCYYPFFRPGPPGVGSQDPTPKGRFNGQGRFKAVAMARG